MSTSTTKDRGGVTIERFGDRLAAYLENQSSVESLRDSGMPQFPWPDANNPMPKFSPPRTVPHGVTLIGRLFDEGTIARVGMALERTSGVANERPPGFA